jgi:outer membrane receptor protein involved in Fe transport
MVKSDFSRAFFLLLLPLLSVPAMAQNTTGALSGTITDPAGAIVAGAKVDVKNEATGTVAHLTTNAAGVYRAAFLIPGTYSVKVQATGFNTYELTGVAVQLGGEPNVNATLKVGDATQTIEVADTSAPLLVTDSSQISANVEAERVVSLPGVQGALDRVALTSPGVVYGFGNINSNGLVFSANGQRARSNNFLLDGQDNNDPTIAGPGYFFSNLEAVGEFQVITNQYSAEYGRNAGAIVNIRVKSGTNAYHGTGTYFHRDDQNFTALDNVQRATGLKNPPKYLDTILGAQVAGPILKNRLFFNIWTQREWVRQQATYIGTSSSLIPTQAGLAELQTYFPTSNTLANLVKYGGYGITLGNPQPVGAVVNQNITTPTGSVISVPFSAIERSVATPSDNWDAGAHVDWRVNDKMSVTGKFYDQNNNTPYSASNGVAGYFIGSPSNSKQPGGSWIWTITPTTVNEFRFSYIKTGFYSEGGNTYGFDNLTKNIANVGITGYLGYGLAYNLPQYRLVNSYQFQDNVSKQLGRHSLKMGVQLIHDDIPLGFLPNVDGVYTYSSFQAYLNNTPATFSGAAGIATQEPNELDQAYYIQDDFRFRPNLTFNIGLRYEYSGQPINLLYRETLARENNPATAIWNSSLPIADRTYPLLPAPSKNFAPRLGFAYTPQWKDGLLGKLVGHDETVIRGGFSIAYDPAFYNLMLNAQTAAPVVFAYSLSSNIIPMPANITGANLQAVYAPPAGVDPRTLNQTLFSGNFKDPYSVSVSLGIQRRIGNNMGFEIRYVGTEGVSLFATRNGNPYIAGFINNGFASALPAGLVAGVNTSCSVCNGRVNPNYGVIRLRDNSGHSNYNGLQMSYNIRNLYHQLTLGTSFTWSKTMDNISEVYGFASTSGGNVLAQDNFNTSGGERALSNNNVPLALSVNATWEMPWLKGNAHWYNRVVGGWNIGMFEVAQAGRPLTITQSNTNVNPLEDASTVALVGGSDQLRPFLSNPSAPLNSVGEFLANGTFVNLANTSQVVALSSVHWVYNTLAADKYFGTPYGVGRNTLTGPSLQQLDLTIRKDFAITEGVRIQIRGEATNAFNHPTFGIPNVNVDVATATTFLNPVSTEVKPRIIRLGFKIIF